MENDLHRTIFEGFEDELVEMIRYTLVDDKQLDVYSLEYASLILKIGSEIEAVAKTICTNSGKHKDSHKFDLNCIEKNKPKIETVMVSHGRLHFSDMKNVFLKPFLKDEQKFVGSGLTYGWNNAYQNIRHGGLDELKIFGSIKYCIHSLGALYILNHELCKGSIPSRLFSYISGDKIIRNGCVISFNNVKELTEEQKEFIDGEN